jgi:hypothetical protein
MKASATLSSPSEEPTKLPPRPCTAGARQYREVSSRADQREEGSAEDGVRSSPGRSGGGHDQEPSLQPVGAPKPTRVLVCEIALFLTPSSPRVLLGSYTV